MDEVKAEDQTCRGRFHSGNFFPKEENKNELRKRREKRVKGLFLQWRLRAIPRFLQALRENKDKITEIPYDVPGSQTAGGSFYDYPSHKRFFVKREDGRYDILNFPGGIEDHLPNVTDNDGKGHSFENALTILCREVFTYRPIMKYSPRDNSVHNVTNRRRIIKKVKKDLGVDLRRISGVFGNPRNRVSKRGQKGN